MEFKSLKQEIGERCSGVLLWVRLVEDILTEYTNGSSLPELKASIDMVPTELDAYYEYMVERLDRLQSKWSAERHLMFEILRYSDSKLPITLAEFFTALQLVPAIKLGGKNVVLPDLGEAERRIYSRCGALVASGN